MHEEYANLKIKTDSLEAFVCCLVLGTLRAMRDKQVSLESGIWTLARPVFSRDPAIEKVLPKELSNILQSADEIEILSDVSGRDEANRLLDKWISYAEARLQELDENMWYAKWGEIEIEHYDPPDASGL